MLNRILSFLFLLLCSIGPVIGVETNVNVPPHEAYLLPIKGIPLLQAIPRDVPEDIKENGPVKVDPGFVWIPGYWYWDANTQNFVWITGVVRRPPPEHQWIQTRWLNTANGWVRIPGFWSPVSEDHIHYIQKRPPEAIQETVEDLADNEFWMMGYWNYNDVLDQYQWVSGQKAIFDANWIFVPAHYTWTEHGYVFIPAYWDWTMDRRGKCYMPLNAPTDDENYEFEPETVWEPINMIPQIVAFYPNYNYFYCHHYHYFPQVWEQWGLAPSWWAWNNSWYYTWPNNWALWWWYTHPGYPQPYWMTRTMANQIAPPPQKLKDKFSGFNPPIIVTKNGVVNPDKLFKAENVVNSLQKKGNGPILPADKPKLDAIISSLQTDKDTPHKIFKPTGKFSNVKNKMPTPVFYTKKEKAQLSENASKWNNKPQRAPQLPNTNFYLNKYVPPITKQSRGEINKTPADNEPKTEWHGKVMIPTHTEQHMRNSPNPADFPPLKPDRYRNYQEDDDYMPQSKGQPPIQPIGQPIRPIGQPTGQPISQPIGQPTVQPINQPTGQPPIQPIGQPSRPQEPIRLKYRPIPVYPQPPQRPGFNQPVKTLPPDFEARKVRVNQWNPHNE